MKRNNKIRNLIDIHVGEDGMQEYREPIYDAINNPLYYDNAPLKLLFINKEPYDVDKEGGIGKGGRNHANI